jgi:hypothetical protein
MEGRHVVPGVVPDFNKQVEPLKELAQPQNVPPMLFPVGKGVRELHQQACQLSLFRERVEQSVDANDVFRCRVEGVREPPKQLHGKRESRVGRDLLNPAFGVYGREGGVVKRRVDFHEVPEPRVKLQFPKPLLLPWRIEHSLEREEIPSPHADENRCGMPVHVLCAPLMLCAMHQSFSCRWL